MEIVIASSYPFKSFRYEGRDMCICLTIKDLPILQQALKQFYPNELPTEKQIQQYVQSNSCGFCLKFGHITDPVVYPSKCPNLPDDYIETMNKLSIKYGVKKEYLNRLLMFGLGTSPICEIEGEITNWSWNMFETQLKLLRCQFCQKMFHSRNDCPLYKSNLKTIKKITNNQANSFITAKL